MRIGILTGGGDVPGLNPCIKAVVNRVVHEGHEVIGLRRGWAALLEYDPDDPASRSSATSCRSTRTSSARSTAPAARSCTRRARTRAASSAKGVPPHLAHRIDGDGPFDFTDHALRVIESLGIDVLIPIGGDDTLSYATADARRGRPRDRDPEDDGQRRPRHRLLHRLLDRDHARRPVHPQPAHEHRLARADRRDRAVRPLQRRDVADHRLSRRRRPRRHLRDPVRHRQARRGC